MSNSSVSERDAYDIDSLATMIIHEDLRIRETKKYQQETDLALDRTMSCNRDEAIDWLKHFMTESISNRKEGNEDWEYKFLASYDIFISLTNKQQ